MKLFMGAIATEKSPFLNFRISKLSIDVIETKSFYSALHELCLNGKLDAHYGNGILSFRTAPDGLEELEAKQYSGKFAIKSTNVQESICQEIDIQRQVFYSAFRRLLLSRGFNSTRGSRTQRGRASPIYGDFRMTNLNLLNKDPFILQQGFKYLLEIRPKGNALLWLDPAISVYDIFNKRYISSAAIRSANLVEDVKKYGVLSPAERVSKLQSLLSLLLDNSKLRVKLADQDEISFNPQLTTLEAG